MSYKISIFVCVLLICASSVHGKNPGVSLFLSADAIDDIVRSTASINAKGLEKLLHQIFHFHDASGTLPTLPFKHLKLPLYWTLQNVDYDIVGVPTQAHARPGKDMMHLEVREMWMRLRGDWAVQSKHKVVQDSGRFNGTFCFTITAIGTIDEQNIIHVKECKTDFCSDVRLDMSYGRVPKWLQRATTRLIEQHMKSDIMCNSMPTFLANRTEYTLLGDPAFLVDLSLVKVTNLSTDGFSFAVVGECFNINNGPLGDTNPMVAPLMPSVTFNKNKMAQFALSSYPISTFVYAMYKANLLWKSIDTSKLSPRDRVMYATRCMDVCIGSAIPQIGKRYPDANVYVSVTMASDGMIETNIEDSYVEFTLGGNLDFHIGNNSLFIVHTVAHGVVVPEVVNKTVVVTGKVMNFTWDTPKVTSTTIGHIPVDVISMLIDHFVNVVFKPLAKGVFKNGIDMGRFFKQRENTDINRQIVRFIDVDIQLIKGLIFVSADFSLEIDHIGNHTV